MDPQLLEILRQLKALSVLAIGINATALLGIVGSVLWLSIYLTRGHRELMQGLARIQESSERIAEMTAQVLREIRER